MAQPTVEKDVPMSESNALFDLPADVANDPKRLNALISAPDDKIQGMIDEWAGKKKDESAQVAQPISEVPTEKAEAVPTAPVIPTPVQDDYKHIVTIPTKDGGNVTLRFKDEKELNQHIANQQKVIDKLNGERGTIGTLKSRSEQLESQVQQLQSQLQKIQTIPSQQMAAPVTPAQASIPTTQVPQDVESMFRKAVEEAVTPLKERLSKYETETMAEKQAAIFDANYRSTLNDVSTLTKELPLLTMSMPFDKINEIVTKRPDQVEGLVSPSDLEKFNQVMIGRAHV